jgi:hypothetical protein
MRSRGAILREVVVALAVPAQRVTGVMRARCHTKPLQEGLDAHALAAAGVDPVLVLRATAAEVALLLADETHLHEHGDEMRWVI